jgi:hypothetical protein
MWNMTSTPVASTPPCDKALNNLRRSLREALKELLKSPRHKPNLLFLLRELQMR